MTSVRDPPSAFHHIALTCQTPPLSTTTDLDLSLVLQLVDTNGELLIVDALGLPRLVPDQQVLQRPLVRAAQRVTGTLPVTEMMEAETGVSGTGAKRVSFDSPGQRE